MLRRKNRSLRNFPDLMQAKGSSFMAETIRKSLWISLVPPRRRSFLVSRARRIFPWTAGSRELISSRKTVLNQKRCFPEEMRGWPHSSAGRKDVYTWDWPCGPHGPPAPFLSLFPRRSEHLRRYGQPGGSVFSESAWRENCRSYPGSLPGLERRTDRPSHQGSGWDCLKSGLH